MQFFVGTSGYSYKEWKGSFYPEKLPQAEMLNYYAQRFMTVEINNTFYRMPRESVLESWVEQVPESFRFVLKAPQTITHRKRLVGAQEATHYFLSAASALRGRRGPILFQLPPNLKKDVPRLESFLELVSGRSATAFEFRHASWMDDEVFEVLRKRSCALCLADTDENPVTELIGTSSWGYLRLRSEGYTDQQLGQWIERIKSQGWSDAYVFFKHEDAGTGPKLAARFLDLLER